MRRLVLLAILACCAGDAAAQERLAAPFGPPGAAAPLSARPCPEPPPPVHDLRSESFYTDRASSVPDPARLAADAAAAQPLRDWLAALQRPAERWVALREAEQAACALRLLDAWASARALLGDFNRQGGYHRKWTLAGASLAFLAVRDAPGAPPEAIARIGAWLGAVAHPVATFYERPPRGHAPSELMNNHVAWAGLAVAAAGVAAGDPALLRRGMAFGATFLGQVTEEGAHPQEVARGQLALHYHLFALQPAAALARLGAAAGEPLAPGHRAALDRLARFAFAQAADSSRLAALAGVPQVRLSRPERPWLADGQGFEIWQGDPAILAALAPFRPYRQAWLGGNVTLLWGR